MKSRRTWVLMLVMAGAATLALKWRLREEPIDLDWPDTWRPRVVRGVVLKDGEPVEGVEVSGGRGMPGVKTGADGRFELAWTEFVWVGHEDRPEGALVRSEPGLMRVTLSPWVEMEGRVVDVDGAPVAGAIVAVSPFAFEARVGKFHTSDAAGRFRTGGHEGQALEVLVTGEGLVPYVERRFRGGDFLTVRAFEGRPIRVRARDPQGGELAPDVFVDLSAAFRGIDPPMACDPSGSLVWLRHAGFLPVQVEVAPHRVTEAILWPKRVVRLYAFDSVRKHGVPRLAVEVDIRPTSGTWRGDIVGAAIRRFPLLPNPDGGFYEADLPACPVNLRINAPGYSDTELTLSAGTTEKRVWMRPLPRAVGGTVEFSGPPGLPIVVAAATGRWSRVVNADATVEVPPDTILQVASLGARAGKWLPKIDLKPLRRGEKRKVALNTLPAVKVKLEITPKVDGEVTVTDVAFKQLKRPRHLRFRGGRLEVWTRPRRVVQFDVRTAGNHFPISFEITTERDGEMLWPISLREAAGLRYLIRDRAGNAVPFARARLWEPSHSGQLELRREPRFLLADAAGSLRFQGLRAGETVVEIAARGFRARLLTLVRLKEGELQDGGELVLEPAGTVEGRLRDYEDRPVAGAWLRVLHPAVRRLPMPGGGERDLYDMVRHSSGTAATHQDGRFKVPDDAVRAPLLACYPTARQDLVRTPLVIGADLKLTGAAYVELNAPGSIVGVYQLLPGGRAVLVAVDPPMSLRPLPLELPAGRVSLFVRLRNRRWAAEELDLARGEKVSLSPKWHDPLR